MLRILLAATHLLALALGLGGVWVRAVALRAYARTGDPGRIRQAFVADAFWGVAALLWLTTGLARWLMGTEKVASYYPGNHLFLAKMGLFVLILLLELRPMLTLGRWRRQAVRGAAPDPAIARTLGTISYIEVAVVVSMVFLATMMARGYGAGGT
jgi:putative membrane protein